MDTKKCNEREPASGDRATHQTRRRFVRGNESRSYFRTTHHTLALTKTPCILQEKQLMSQAYGRGMTTKSEKALRIAWSNRWRTDTWITLRRDKSGTCDLDAEKTKNPTQVHQTMPQWLENKREDEDQKNQLGFPSQHLRIFLKSWTQESRESVHKLATLIQADW